MSLPYLDIHTHRRDFFEGSVNVLSLSKKEIEAGQVQGEYLTAGIHPWWLEDESKDDVEKLKSQIKQLIEQGKLWAIGETGLDRLYPEFLELQIDTFKWHIDLSEEYGLPLVIHNVRTGSDMLAILKEKRPKSAWIFHDFRGNDVLLKDILKLHPNSYFSFGISIDNSQTIRELLPDVPLSNLFLETDEQKHLDIHDIYLRAAHHLDVDLEFLKAQIWHNFNKLRHSV